MNNRNNINAVEDNLLHTALNQNFLNSLSKDLKNLLIDDLWHIIVSYYVSYPRLHDPVTGDLLSDPVILNHRNYLPYVYNRSTITLLSEEKFFSNTDITESNLESKLTPVPAIRLLVERVNLAKNWHLLPVNVSPVQEKEESSDDIHASLLNEEKVGLLENNNRELLEALELTPNISLIKFLLEKINELRREKKQFLNLENFLYENRPIWQQIHALESADRIDLLAAPNPGRLKEYIEKYFCIYAALMGILNPMVYLQVNNSIIFSILLLTQLPYIYANMRIYSECYDVKRGQVGRLKLALYASMVAAGFFKMINETDYFDYMLSHIIRDQKLLILFLIALPGAVAEGFVNFACVDTLIENISKMHFDTTTLKKIISVGMFLMMSFPGFYYPLRMLYPLRDSLEESRIIPMSPEISILPALLITSISYLQNSVGSIYRVQQLQNSLNNEADMVVFNESPWKARARKASYFLASIYMAMVIYVYTKDPVLAFLAAFRMFVVASLPEAVRSANNPYIFLPAPHTRELATIELVEENKAEVVEQKEHKPTNI